MKNYVVKSTIIFTIIYVFVISVIFLLFYWYNDSFEKEYAIQLGGQQQDIYHNTFSKMLTDDFQNFMRLANEETLENLNLEKTQHSYRNVSYQAFYELTEEGVMIGGTQYPFINKEFYTRNYDSAFSMYSLNKVFSNQTDETVYGVFKYNNKIGLIDLSLFLKNYLPYNAQNTLIMRQNGLILGKLNPGGPELLKDLVTTSTTSMFNDYISKGLNHLAWVEIDGKTNLIALSLIEGSTLYFITIYQQDILILSFNNVRLYLLSALGLIGLAFIIANLLTFYTSFVRFTDIENARLKVYLNKRMIIKVSSFGKLIGFNRGFRKAIVSTKRFKKLSDFNPPDLEENVTLFDRIKKGFSFTVELDTHDGSAFVKFIPLKMGLSYVLVGDNLTKEDILLKEYESLALINKLTKLPNYNYFNQVMSEIIHKTNFSESKHVIIALNLLDFRSIVKLVGEKIADQTIIDFVDILKNSLKKFEHEIFNTYLDNFLIIIKNVKEIEKVEEWVSDLVIYLEASTNLAGTTLHLDLRAGIYELKEVNNVDINPELIFDRTMVALKNANQSSTSKYAIYDVTLRDLVTQRQRLELSLIEAIENKEFVMYLQPQVDIVYNRIVSFEALIRWNNPKYNHISPIDFIRLAEENNLIIHIGQIVMEETAKLAKKLEKYNITIAMNISPVQMIQKGFVHQFEQILEKYQLNPHAIALEITETFMVNSLQLMSEKLKLLQKMGIDIHLDDFGMGYSSLAYLKDLPINMIKIDKQFIDQIASDKYSKAIVTMIVSLSKSIGVNIIAEGVETDAQRQVLQKMGVQIIQGWLISKAVPFETALALLEEYNGKLRK